MAGIVSQVSHSLTVHHRLNGIATYETQIAWYTLNLLYLQPTSQVMLRCHHNWPIVSNKQLHVYHTYSTVALILPISTIVFGAV